MSFSTLSLLEELATKEKLTELGSRWLRSLGGGSNIVWFYGVTEINIVVLRYYLDSFCATYTLEYDRDMYRVVFPSTFSSSALIRATQARRVGNDVITAVGVHIYSFLDREILEVTCCPKEQVLVLPDAVIPDLHAEELKKIEISHLCNLSYEDCRCVWTVKNRGLHIPYSTSRLVQLVDQVCDPVELFDVPVIPIEDQRLPSLCSKLLCLPHIDGIPSFQVIKKRASYVFLVYGIPVFASNRSLSQSIDMFEAMLVLKSDGFRGFWVPLPGNLRGFYVGDPGSSFTVHLPPLLGVVLRRVCLVITKESKCAVIPTRTTSITSFTPLYDHTLYSFPSCDFWFGNAFMYAQGLQRGCVGFTRFLYREVSNGVCCYFFERNLKGDGDPGIIVPVADLGRLRSADVLLYYSKAMSIKSLVCLAFEACKGFMASDLLYTNKQVEPLTSGLTKDDITVLKQKKWFDLSPHAAQELSRKFPLGSLPRKCFHRRSKMDSVRLYHMCADYRSSCACSIIMEVVTSSGTDIYVAHCGKRNEKLFQLLSVLDCNFCLDGVIVRR